MLTGSSSHSGCSINNHRKLRECVMQNIRLDYYAARLCMAAASDKPMERVVNLMDNHIETVDKSGVKVYVGDTPSHNVAVFDMHQDLGKVTFKQIMQSIKDAPTDQNENPYQIAKPLYDKWAFVGPSAYSAVNTIHYAQAYDDKRTKPWMFTGHGTGGQLAQLAAASYMPATLITFGSPNAGGDLLLKAVDDACMWTRWEVVGDWTAKLPLRLWNTKGGCSRYITEDGELELKPQSTFFRPQDWFQRAPINLYHDWIEEALQN